MLELTVCTHITGGKIDLLSVVKSSLKGRGDYIPVLQSNGVLVLLLEETTILRKILKFKKLVFKNKFTKMISVHYIF